MGLIQKIVEKLAKRDAMAFANFIQDNSYTKTDKKGWYQYYRRVETYPTGFAMSTPVYTFFTIEEIYDLYLKSKKVATSSLTH